MPTQLSLHQVTKAYGERLLLDHVTFALPPEARTGIIGENGAGKSTLLRLLTGEESPDDGRVTVHADGGVGYLAQESSEPDHLTVREVIEGALAPLRAMEARLRQLEPQLAAGDPAELAEYGDLATVFELRGGYDADARVERAMHGLGLSQVGRARRVGDLSGGERARLRLASVLAAGSELLLLDEPTNHLDDAALRWLEEHLRGRRGTTVVVSHDRVFLERVVTELVEVDADRRTLTRYGGGYAGYLAARAAARARWRQEYEQWCAEIARLREVAATTARQVAPGRAMTDRNKLSYDRNAGRVEQSVASRVRNAERRLERLRAEPVPPPPEPLRFTPPPGRSRADGVLVEAVDVAVAGRLRPCSLQLAAGDRLLVSGLNGAGKSTLLRVLASDLAPERGEVTRRGRCGYLPQEVTFADPRQTLLAAFAHGLPGPVDGHIRPLLALGLFFRDELTVPVGQLSTGQRHRLALARLFRRPVDLLLLDEPTNHLSLELAEQLEQALEDYPGAVVVVSHDRRLRQRWRGEQWTLTGATDPDRPG